MRTHLALGSLLLVATPTLPATAASIRDTDFANFVYHLEGTCEFGDCGVALAGGRFEGPVGSPDPVRSRLSARLGFVRHGDLTGDGLEDAVVRLGWSTGGTGQLSQVFVYTHNGQEPRLLDKLPTGDRAHGSYVDACFDNNELVIVREWSTDCAVCLEGIETVRYAWLGARLVRKSSEVQANPLDSLPTGLPDVTTECGPLLQRVRDWSATPPNPSNSNAVRRQPEQPR